MINAFKNDLFEKEERISNIQIQNLNWTPLSWQNYIAGQQPHYLNLNYFEKTLKILNQKESLISYSEIEVLKEKIHLAALGKAFILQSGDCAEQFSECLTHIIRKKINFINLMYANLETYLAKPVVQIGRIAGQYAKPRSSQIENHNGQLLPAYKGDIIHSKVPTLEARQPNPKLLLEAFQKSKKTLSVIKKQHLLNPLFVSHEAMLLCYESALTRRDCLTNNYFNSSTHFVWLGERTRQLTGAHVEYLRGIANPIGLKISSEISSQELLSLILKCNPNNEQGKIILIPRYGAKYVEKILPNHIDAVKQLNFNVAWMCDPMHGNGQLSHNNFKTRDYKNIEDELNLSIKIHENKNSILAGVHLESTFDNVTECIGGPYSISPEELKNNYKTACDPRLNGSQSLELLKVFKSN